MDSHKEDRYSMFLKVDLFLQNNATDLAFNPAIATSQTTLHSYISLIAQADSTATRDITGFTAAKNQHRADQIEQFKLVRAALMGYYTTSPDIKVKEIIDYEDSEIDKFRDSELYMKTDQVLDIALPIKTMLVPFGATAAQVDALDTLNNAWQALEPIGRLEEAVNKASAKDVGRYFDKTFKLLDDTLDSYLKVVQYNNPNLYDQYLTARMIDDSGGNSGTDGYLTQDMIIPAGGTISWPMGEPGTQVPPETQVYVRAITNTMYVCTTAAPEGTCAPGAGTFVADKGVTFKGNIGSMGLDLNNHYIHITNPSADDGIIRVGVQDDDD
jgi:hypothetical protein